MEKLSFYKSTTGEVFRDEKTVKEFENLKEKLLLEIKSNFLNDQYLSSTFKNFISGLSLKDFEVLLNDLATCEDAFTNTDYLEDFSKKRHNHFWSVQTEFLDELREFWSKEVQIDQKNN